MLGELDGVITVVWLVQTEPRGGQPRRGAELGHEVENWLLVIQPRLLSGVPASGTPRRTNIDSGAN